MDAVDAPDATWGRAFSRARSAPDITQILRRKKVFGLIDRSALTEVA